MGYWNVSLLVKIFDLLEVIYLNVMFDCLLLYILCGLQFPFFTDLFCSLGKYVLHN